MSEQPPDPDQAAAPIDSPEPEARAAWPLRSILILVVVVALVAGGLGGLAGAWWQGRDHPLDGSSSLPKAPSGSTGRPPDSVAGVVRRVLPSVVTLKVAGGGEADTGSGFVVRADGYVVTNNHVIAAAATGGTISVVFSDGKSSKATVVGSDASYDLAVVKVDRSGLPELRLGESRDVVVGDPVIAVGAPLGLQGSVTTGIVSALNRPVSAGGEASAQSSFINAIQTDAAINPGNSGGPLVDADGDVIGVNSAIAQIPGGGGAGAQSGSIGVGFAIPSDQVRITVKQLIATGKAVHPVIGVLLDSQYAGPGVRVSTKAPAGQSVIAAGGPADRAGIKPGDVILTLDGQPVTDQDAFVVAIRAHAPGDVVTLTVRTGSRQRSVKLTLQASTD
jgi:putative serine protease PepD